MISRVFALLLLISTPVWAQNISCTDIDALIDQSETKFNAIQQESRHEHGGFKTTTILPEAEYCLIFEDPEKRTYQCTWAYPLGASDASSTFERYAKDIGDCLDNRAIMIKDQAVNHPDTYSSYIYNLPKTEVRVTLKNKSKLKSTLVSVFVTGV
ncbi:MAG: hypothetical protein AB8B87_12625 [Granulosicoccus sp.]